MESIGLALNDLYFVINPFKSARITSYNVCYTKLLRTEEEAAPSGLYRSNDGGATWERTNSNNTRPFYYSQVRVDPKDPDRVYWSSTPDVEPGEEDSVFLGA